MNFEEILGFSLAWAKSGKSLKYYLGLLLIPVVLLVVLAVMALSSLGPLVATALKNPTSVYSPAFFGQAMGAALSFIALLFLWIILYLLVEVFLNAWVTLYGLRSKNLPAVSLSFGKFFGLIVLHILQMLSLFFFPAGKRTRYIVWACLLLMLLSMFVPVLLLFGIVYLPLYVVALLYSTFRMFPSTSIFLSQGTGAWTSIKESWSLTQGKVLHIFVAFVLILLVVIVLSIVIDTILGLLFTPLVSGFTANLNLGISAVFVNKTIADTIAGFLYGPLLTLMWTFGIVAIYADLLANKGK